MRAMSAGHRYWNPKYFMQFSSAYRDAIGTDRAARRYPLESGRAMDRSHAVRFARFVMPGSRNEPGYGMSDAGLICMRSIWVRAYSTLRYS